MKYPRHSGPIAQRLEQGTHNPLVPGSNPGGPTSLLPTHGLPVWLRTCRAGGNDPSRRGYALNWLHGLEPAQGSGFGGAGLAQVHVVLDVQPIGGVGIGPDARKAQGQLCIQAQTAASNSERRLAGMPSEAATVLLLRPLASINSPIISGIGFCSGMGFMAWSAEKEGRALTSRARAGRRPHGNRSKTKALPQPAHGPQRDTGS